ncbi:MAG: glutathione S-transferase family protein [Burkholderiales bacterium]|nr:glutathione S-transferase family protein [Burkholderiales bacterium]
MLTVHHLGKSQSERIVWLCEELGIPYELKHYARDAKTMLAPPEMRKLHPLGSAPVITDGDLVLAESGAIVDYVIARHGNGRLALGPQHPDYPSYVYWFHFANSNLQPLMHRGMQLQRLKLPADHPILIATLERLDRAMRYLDDRLAQARWLAGNEFTAADIMIVFTLTTMRHFMPLDLAPYAHVLAYLQRVAQREAYRVAMEKADPGMERLLD